MKLTPAARFAALALAMALPFTASAEELASGTAKGTCANKGEKAVALKFATAFVDQKDDRKPTVLILSDVKLPAEKWTSEFDLMRATGKNPFSGAVFFVKDGAAYRSDFYWQGNQAGVSGYYTLKLDAKPGKELTGSVVSESGKETDPKVDATFHATLK